MTSDEPVFLETVLRPSPPMRAGTLLFILACVTAMNVVFALYFVLRGAWPIAPFMGADVALLAWAFHASRVAATRFEHVMLTPSRLRVTRHAPRRSDLSLEFNPYWVSLELPDPEHHGSQLKLRSHGRSEMIGSFLAPQERLSFAERLDAALWRVKNFRG